MPLQVQTCTNTLSWWLSTAHKPTRPGAGTMVTAGCQPSPAAQAVCCAPCPPLHPWPCSPCSRGWGRAGQGWAVPPSRPTWALPGVAALSSWVLLAGPRTLSSSGRSSDSRVQRGHSDQSSSGSRAAHPGIPPGTGVAQAATLSCGLQQKGTALSRQSLSVGTKCLPWQGGAHTSRTPAPRGEGQPHSSVLESAVVIAGVCGMSMCARVAQSSHGAIPWGHAARNRPALCCQD